MKIKMMDTDLNRFGIVNEKGIATIDSKFGGKHSYSVEERTTFAKMTNHILKKDDDCSDKIPMNVEDESLFHAFDNGILLCKLLMNIDPDCIDSRAINRQSNMNVYQVKENLQMAIAAAKGLGIKLVGINSSDFIKKVPHMMMGVLW